MWSGTMKASGSPFGPPLLLPYGTFSPHSGQNFAPAVRAAPHFEQLSAVLILAPHSGQNLAFVA